MQKLVYTHHQNYCSWILNWWYTLLAGDIEEFPGLDPIPAYSTQIDQITHEVKINMTAKNKLKGNGFIKPLCKSDDANEDIVVIIGSGYIYVLNQFNIFLDYKFLPMD